MSLFFWNLSDADMDIGSVYQSCKPVTVRIPFQQQPTHLIIVKKVFCDIRISSN